MSDSPKVPDAWDPELQAKYNALAAFSGDRSYLVRLFNLDIEDAHRQMDALRKEQEMRLRQQSEPVEAVYNPIPAQGSAEVLNSDPHQVP